MKKIMIALMAVVAMVGMNSCKVEIKDIDTTVTNGGSNEGLMASMEILPLYVNEIVKEQGGEQFTSNGSLLRNQSDDRKAKQGALTAANKVKSEVLAKKTYEIQDIFEKITVSIEEGSKEDFNMVIRIYVDGVEYIAHYYKVKTLK